MNRAGAKRSEQAGRGSEVVDSCDFSLPSRSRRADDKESSHELWGLQEHSLFDFMLLIDHAMLLC